MITLYPNSFLYFLLNRSCAAQGSRIFYNQVERKESGLDKTLRGPGGLSIIKYLSRGFRAKWVETSKMFAFINNFISQKRQQQTHYWGWGSQLQLHLPAALSMPLVLWGSPWMHPLYSESPADQTVEVRSGLHKGLHGSQDAGSQLWHSPAKG